MVSSIAFDVDGPLVFDNKRLQRFFLFLLDQGIQCNHEAYLLTGHWQEAVPGLTRPDISEAWLRYKLQEDLQDVPTPGAIAALKLLGNTERIIATARTSSEQADTLQFLNHHYGVFKECHFELDCKVLVAQQASYFIDDNVGIANSVAAHVQNGTKVILFPAPGVSGRVTHKRVVTLEAEKHIAPDISEEKWCQVCEMAWQEITTIIRSSP